MSRQLAVWSQESDVYVLQDHDLTTIVVNKPRPNTYMCSNEGDYLDKLVELKVAGYKIPSELILDGLALETQRLGLV